MQVNNAGMTTNIVTVAAEGTADLSTSASSQPDPVAVCNQLIYTLTVVNNGANVASNTVITDSLPSGFTFAAASAGCTEVGGIVACDLNDLPANSTSQVAIVVTPTTTGTFVNTATTSSDTSDPVSSNDVGSTTNTVLATLPGNADISTIKSGSASIAVSNQLTYTISVINSGPDTATNVIVVDTLPVTFSFVSASAQCTDFGRIVICNLGDLLSSNTGQVAIVALPTTTGTFVNTVTSTSDTGDPNPDNNTGVAITTVTDLGLIFSVTSIGSVAQGIQVGTDGAIIGSLFILERTTNLVEALWMGIDTVAVQSSTISFIDISNDLDLDPLVKRGISVRIIWAKKSYKKTLMHPMGAPTFFCNLLPPKPSHRNSTFN
ncbi:MAG: DUF11 domain-containing protein [Kiritimatiellae bacterium]|nr:DUF11 domain-containing protein [Kiritimatiellia bacterium]